MDKELISKIKNQILKSQNHILDSYVNQKYTPEWYEENIKGWKELADLWMQIADHYLEVIQKLQKK